MLVTSSWVVDLVLLFVATSVILYKYSTRKFDYWKKRGVYHKKPVPFLGNMADPAFFLDDIGNWLKKIYDSTNEPYFGVFVFDKPVLVIKSPELIKQILVRDFSNFNDRTIASPKHDKLISNLLFFQKNPIWKESRSKLTPVFTSGKLKNMLPLIESVGDDLQTYLEKNEGVLEAKEVCARFTTDVIAKCFFGINAFCLEDDTSEFRKAGKSIFGFTWRNAIVQTSFFFRQNWVEFFKLDFIEKRVLDYFREIFSKVLQARRQQNDAKKNDLVDILNDLRKKGELSLDAEQIIGPAVQFFIAGFDTTSAAISFSLYELCKNKDIQNKLRTEVLESIEEHGGITYEGLLGMKYLDMCIKETLRIYSLAPLLDRTCNEDYQLPGTNLVIEKGMSVYISMYGLHLDEKYFPEPMKFNPDRFLDNNYNKDGFVYIPFGEGPRVCIGERFGLMTTKAALSYIISKFEVEKCATTPDPVIFEPKSLIIQSKVGLPMRFRKIIPTQD